MDHDILGKHDKVPLIAVPEVHVIAVITIEEGGLRVVAVGVPGRNGEGYAQGYSLGAVGLVTVNEGVHVDVAAELQGPVSLTFVIHAFKYYYRKQFLFIFITIFLCSYFLG